MALVMVASSSELLENQSDISLLLLLPLLDSPTAGVAFL